MRRAGRNWAGYEGGVCREGWLTCTPVDSIEIMLESLTLLRAEHRPQLLEELPEQYSLLLARQLHEPTHPCFRLGKYCEGAETGA